LLSTTLKRSVRKQLSVCLDRNVLTDAHTDAPLKDTMVGVELLVARLQIWQDHNASEREGTSLASHQAPLAALSARWRRLELCSWSVHISKVLEREERGAWVHWFHLYGLLFGSPQSPPEPATVLPVIEQFVQTSPVGQFMSRLGLLTLCAAHCFVNAAIGRRGYKELGYCLSNMAAYYAQHAKAVHAAMEENLSPVRKELKVQLLSLSRNWLWSCT
jgi:hypothetical protein